MHFTPYALPALAALFANGAIFFYARYSSVHNFQTRIYLLFLFSLSIQNLAEIRIFFSLPSEVTDATGGRLWFSSTIFAIALFLHLALVLSGGWRGKRGGFPLTSLLLVYTPGAVLQVMLWFTPFVIVGFQSMSFTITKVPGPLYFLFELYALGYLLGATGLLVGGARNQALPFRRLQNKLLLCGLIPFVVLALLVIGLQRLGFRGFNATIAQPAATTFFLAITAYAIHQYRLFDIEFFLPWSKIRRRKSAFYQRIQATIAAITELRSVGEITQLIADALRCQLAVIGGPQPVTAFVEGQDRNKGAPPLSKFPRRFLEKVAHITVAHEIADTDPALYRVMETYRVGAIVPFKSHGKVAAHWLVLGDHFNNEVYTPLDFQVVERLFAAMAERFLDDFLYVRSQLKKTEEQLRRTTLNLGHAWHKEHQVKRKLNLIRVENRELRDEIAGLRRETLKLPKAGAPAQLYEGKMTLEEYLSACEKEAVISALDRCAADKLETARLLGVTLHTLEYLMERHDISEDSWTIR